MRLRQVKRQRENITNEQAQSIQMTLALRRTSVPPGETHLGLMGGAEGMRSPWKGLCVSGIRKSVLFAPDFCFPVLL